MRQLKMKGRQCSRFGAENRRGLGGERERWRAVGWQHLPGAMVLKLEAASESPAGLLGNQIAEPQPQEF